MEAFEGRFKKVHALITTINANRDKLINAAG